MLRLSLSVTVALLLHAGPTHGPLTRDVTIYRDRYGIPHVYGRTPADAVFGFAYAQAEDHVRQLEDNFIRALGRRAEVDGQAAWADDWLNRALAIPRLAREEFARLDPEMRDLLIGFAEGVNLWLERHPAHRPRLLPRIEPWYPLAFIRYNYYQGGFAGGALRQAGLRSIGAQAPPEREDQGSNGWVVAPARSASGRALLFINPHLPWFGPGQVYEGHLHSEDGWDFTGYARFGFPFPYVGHNGRVGWVSTDNAADLADLYLETFDDPARPLAYRYGDGYRLAEEWTDTIGVRVGGEVVARSVTFRRTHHGPIVAASGGKPVALRMAKLEADGWLREWYRMTRARTLVEFKAAMEPLEMQFGNAMYADQAGNIYYIYNGAIPRRDPSFDWSRPVDGSDPRTEWQGFHSFAELPQLENPASGWMQNCNGTPFLLTDDGNPDPARYANYMVSEGDNARSVASRRILRANDRWTFAAWSRAAFDTKVVMADSLLGQLLAGARPATDGGRAAAALLERWDRRSDTGSVAMTLFNAWMQQGGPRASLDAVVGSLEARFGDWRVPWGEASRIQRWDPFAGEGARDARRSLALPGVPSGLGAVFTAAPAPQPGQRRYYGVAGGSYVSVVEFGPEVRAMAVHTFGASGDSASAHFFDQAPLFTAGRFRPVWFTLPDIRANLERAYRPGEER